MHEEKLLNWKCLLQPMESCISSDFSRCNITHIPDDILGQFSNIQFLYLEGNHLTELSSAFFPTLRELRWLDLRNNKLTSVPNSIMDHPSLQVLLLEGNNLESIPVEVGSVATLRGLQLARNPIKFPPLDIVNQGVQRTIEFLRKQWQQTQSPQQIHLVSETHSQTKTIPAKSKCGLKLKVSGCKSAVVLKATNREPKNLRKTQSGLCAANLSKCINVQPISRHRQQAASTRPPGQNQVFSNQVCRKKSPSFSKQTTGVPLHNDQLKRTGDMQSKLLRDIWIEKVREMLLQQEAIIQKRKNADALQQWQDETKMLQQTLPRKGISNADINFPYDTDPEFLKMLSRKDLKEAERCRRRESSLHNIRHEEPINNKIVSIMAAIQELQSSQSATSMSPRSEQRMLSNEIKKIRDIQRSLSALKLKNFGQLGFSS